MSQSTITGDKPEDLAPVVGVYAVVTSYLDDPHPHVEGVFDNEEDARELLKQCGAHFGGPFPDAWSLFKLAPGNVEQLAP